jgi:DNA polymerase-3 subunit delta
MNLKNQNKYLITGSKFFLDDNIEKICKNFTDPEINIYFGDEFDKEDFFSFIFTPSLFYDSKIAIINNSEKLKEINILLENALKSIEATIIFLFNETDLKKIKFENKDKFKILSENKVNKYNAGKIIKLMFADKGFDIKSLTAEDIYEMCFQDINLVKMELDKLDIYYYGKNKPEDDKNILEIISFTKNETIFKFIDSFFDRKKQMSIYSLDNIISTGESAEMLFYMLSKRVQQILLYKISPSFIKIHPYTLSKVEKSASIWSDNEIYLLINEIADIDFDMKTGKANIIDKLYSLISFL